LATANNFTIKNGLTISTTDVINSSGDWIGPQTNVIGLTGPQGVTGPQGTRGPQGATGPQGLTGPQGVPGSPSAVTGPQGAAGPQGATGPQGLTGPQGFTGPTSAVTGPQGLTGTAGTNGPQGATGPQGVTGPQGATGPTSGVSGAQGATGPQGPSGSTSSLSTTVTALGVGTAAGPTGDLRATTSITAFYSDIRLKDNIESIKDAGKKLYSMNGIFYTQNKLAEKYGYNDYSEQVGLFAQEVKEVLPEVVGIAPFDIDGKDKSKSGEYFLTISYEKIIPLIIETIKEQQKEIDSLEESLL
jgi:hypothetical protein